MRNRKENIILEKVEVTDLAAEGKALARIDNMVLFISGAVPGDVVDVKVLRKKRNYMEGTVERFIKESSERVPPRCVHFGICGGCTWQQLPYSKQLFYKERQVRDNLERIGKTGLLEVEPILPSEQTFEYRNKLEYTFSHRRWLTREEIGTGKEFGDMQGLGFHVPGKFDKVLDIRQCHLQSEPSNAIRLAVREYALEHGLEFFDILNKKGLLRNLIIRNNQAGEFMVIVSFLEDIPETRDALLTYLASRFPEITALLYAINPKGNDTLNDLEIKTFRGQDHLIETMEDLRFRISPRSFFQTNTQQALQLYRLTREMAGLTGTETVYDLYTGTGTIALFLANRCRKIVGIEYVPEAIEDAKVNASLNGIQNARFYAGDMKQVLTADFFGKEGKPDVVILDPPRAGVQEEVLVRIMDALPSRIVYVSCNPSTQARDIAILAANYKPVRIQPVDMFPHTVHVENIIQLDRIS